MKLKKYSLSLKVLLRNKSGLCLIIKRSPRNTHYPGFWEFPGGKMNACETIEDALVREVKKETGLSIKLERAAGIVESELPEWRIVHLIMEARALPGDVRLSEEHDACRWIPVKDLLKMDMPDHFRDFCRRYMDGKGG